MGTSRCISTEDIMGQLVLQQEQDRNQIDHICDTTYDWTVSIVM